jgi:hypothetical protein
MEYEFYEDVVDAYEAGIGVEPGDSLTDYIRKNNIKIKEIEPFRTDSKDGGLMYAYGGGVGHLMEPSQTYHQYHDFTAPMTVGAMVDNMYKSGGRVALQNGSNWWDNLSEPGMNVYNAMKDAGHDDSTIQGQLSMLGYYDANAGTPDPTPDPTPGQGGGQGGGGGGGGGEIMELQKTYSTLPGDPKNYQLSQLEGTSDYFPPTTKMGKIGNFFNELGSKKVKGTLGDRLQKQSQGIMSKIPIPGSWLGRLRSPFNANSPTYNAALPMQLNFLEGITGSKIGGTSKDGLTITEGVDMIGRDPNSGHLKYGPGSVLAGKNVISGFGSNDYETALNKYLSRMLRYENPSKFQSAKIQQARDELAALQAKTEQEYIDSGTQAEVQAIQNKINQQENKINQAASKKDSKSGASTVNPNSAYGKKQGYTGGHHNPHTSTGWSGSTKSSKSSKGNNPWGRKDGGAVGLASMFTRRR